MVGEAMGLFSTETDRGIAASLSQLADGIGKLVTQHLQLARIELTEDARALGIAAAKIAAFLPFVLVGYALLCVALAVGLAEVMPLWAGFLIVGGANVVGGALGLYLAAMSMKNRELLDQSRRALESTRALFTAEPANPQLPSRGAPDAR
jgi:uncharacterized membrane protein YqjE